MNFVDLHGGVGTSLGYVNSFEWLFLTIVIFHNSKSTVETLRKPTCDY